MTAELMKKTGILTFFDENDNQNSDFLDRYGAVQRAPVPSNLAQIQTTNSRYTPPALRAPTGHPTVPGAPHDPAIIASQLVRPETMQQKQQQQQPPPPPQAPRATLPQTNLPLQQSVKPEDAASKPKEKSPLPEIIAPKRIPMPGASDNPSKHGTDAPRLPEVTRDFKQFVNMEKERYYKKKADLVQRDRATKLEELKKFSLSFTLKTEVPQDLVPILAKDKQKQAEIVERAKANVAKAVSPTVGSTSQATKPLVREPPPNSFAAKNPVEFQNIKQQLLHGFPRQQQRPPPNQQQNATLSSRLYQIQDARSRGQQIPVRSPVPISEHPQAVPTGPAAGNNPVAPKSISPASMGLRMNAKAMEFKPNPSAATFTPTFGGPSTTATPSPTTSAHAHPSPRAASPSLFFRTKKPLPEHERKSIRNSFNPIKRMKAAHKTAPAQTDPKKSKGNSHDFIDPSFCTTPIWPTTNESKDKTYKQMFAKTEYSVSSTMHSPQPPHITPHQPHHQQAPPHMPHVNQPPHVPHQPHHPHMPQHHLGIPPPHYEQDQHLRQIPPSVMPSPSLHNATIAPYQQSPVAHHSQLGPMYAAHPQAGVGQYVPGGPAPQFVGQFYAGFRGAAGTGQMMVHGPQPIPYPAGGQFMPHPQMYSPQQPHAYLHNGAPPPPPPSSQGYPSPGRGAPMMMHQGSSQGTPTGPQMVPYAIQPGQGGPIYTGQGQQQSEFFLQGQNWLPQRPQSTVSLPPVPSSSATKPGFSRAASPVVPSPRIRNSHLSPQISTVSPLLMSSLAAFSPAPSASGPGLSSYTLQRSQTGNMPMHAGGGGRAGKHGSNSGSGGMAAPMMIPTGFVISAYSNNGPVGMMRGQPPPPHQGGPPPPQYYHAPQGHYPPGGRGNAYGGHPQQQHQGGQHVPPPPPQAQSQQTTAEGEDGK